MRSKITSALTVLGAVTVLVLAANTVALAANGKGFLLGKTNSATKVSVLKRTTNGPALGVVTKRVTDAPFTVNGKGRVTNLNADTIDGKDSSLLGTRALLWAYAGSTTASTSRTWVTSTLPAGTYLFNYELYLSNSTYAAGNPLNCYLRRNAENLFYGESVATGTPAWGTGTTGTGIISLTTAGVVKLTCRTTTSTTWDISQNEAMRITAVPITGYTLKGFPADGKQVAGRAR